MPATELEKHGINASDVKKLQDAGMYTAEAVRHVESSRRAGLKQVPSTRTLLCRRLRTQRRRACWQ